MSSLLRSTKFVRYFAGAARTLFLNSAKTAETHLLVNAKVSTVVSNVLIRDYATSKKTESLDPLLQRIDSEVRRYGRISKRDIEDVFEEIRAKQNITSSQSLLVIRCCGELVPEELPEQRTKLVQKIWAALSDVGVPMDISHYNALLRVYIENEHQFSPAEFLEELEKKELQANRVTYQRLMWRYCQQGDVEGATRVLEKMRELGFPVSEPVLNALVMGHAFLGDTDGAKAVLETMAGAGLQPSNRTYALLACGYAKKGDLENVHSTLKIANEKDAIMSNKDILDIIESLAISGHGDKIEGLFDHLMKGYGYNQDVCNLILRLINKGHVDDAKKIMKTMPKSERSEETMYKGAFFVKQLIKLNKTSEEIIQICKDLQQENLVPSALYIATEGALQHGLTNLALDLFKELQNSGLELRQHYYWPLLVKKSKENDEEGLLHVLKNMTSEGITPSGEALRDYILPYFIKKNQPQSVITKLQIANVPVVHAARNLICELLDLGRIKEAAELAVQYKPYGQFPLMSRPLLNAIAKSKDVESFVTILHVINSKQNISEETPSEDSHNEEPTDVGRIILSAAKNLVKPELIEQLLTELHSKGLRISTSTAEAIEQYLAGNLTSSISETLVKLTSAELQMVPIQSSKRPAGIRSTAQIEQIIARNQSNGTVNYRLNKQLLIAYIQENNVEKVDKYVKDMQKDNVELTGVMLAQLLEFYASHDLPDKALECKELLQKNHSGFTLNKFKIVELANALVKADRFDEAVKIIEDYSNQDTAEEGSFLVNSKSWQILNTLAEKKDSAKVHQMTDLLIKQNIVDASNVILGPSIKVYLLNEDIEGALKQFEHCCKQYRCTPWKGEVMKTLIMKEDATRLQWVADISTQIHGEVNILHDLVLAFVECGRLRQARRILETPGLVAKHRRLNDACERYVQEGQTEHLEGLLEATKELSHIDRTNIFNHLLQSYCKANETDKALGLWTLLQEEGEVPSQKFLATLAAHLRSKGREVPFIAPEVKTKQQPKKTEAVGQKETKIKTTPTKKETSAKLEDLIKAGNLDQAKEFTLQSFKEGVYPQWNVVKYLLKQLADGGNAEQIRELEPYLDENARRNVTYDDKLTLAIFNSGKGAEHIDSLHKQVLASQSEKELLAALVKFPRSNALASVVQSEGLINKCREVAELASTKGHQMPINLLWMEYVLAGNIKDADEVWNKHLIASESIAYRRLLQEAHVQNKPELFENLITYLKTNKNTNEKVLGNVYSRLINLHLVYDNLEEAKRTLEKASKDGVTNEIIARNTLNRLQAAIDGEGKK